MKKNLTMLDLLLGVSCGLEVVSIDDICKTLGCDAYLPDVSNELAQQADYHGMESLTEQQQAFMEGAQPGLCPDCMV